MKRIKLMMSIALSLSVIMGVATVSAAAADGVLPHSLPISSIQAEVNTESVSHGLQVIAQIIRLLFGAVLIILKKGNYITLNPEQMIENIFLDKPLLK